MTPAFIIEPMDEEYEISENLFRFDEAEFNEKIRCTGFAANEGDVDMVLKMRSLIYSQNLFLCVWNIRADALINIYLYLSGCITENVQCYFCQRR